MKQIGLYTLFFLVLNPMNAQLDKAKLDHYFDVLEQNQKFNGGVALSENGKIIYERSLGYADFGSQKKINSETKFRIGSISKTFTAVLIMKMVDEGKMDIYKKLCVYLPDLKNCSEITVEQLMNHHSGIFNFTNDPDYLNWNTKAKSRKELLDMINTYESVFDPGSKAEYSNSNYVLLTLVLEKTYGKPYEEILQEKIIRPLDLKNTFIGGTINLEKNEAYSYKKLYQWEMEPETDMSIPLGAGAVISTPHDIIKFGEALFGGKIISETSLNNMKIIKDGYGFGLFEFPFYEKKALGHTGGIDGFSSMWGYFANEKVSIAITSNGSDINNNDIAVVLLSAVFNQPYEIPTFAKPNADAVPGYTGIFSNSQIGMKITVTESDGQFFAQATGQSAFPLEKASDFQFKFAPAGIVMEFAEDLKSFTLLQGGGKFVFFKE